MDILIIPMSFFHDHELVDRFSNFKINADYHKIRQHLTRKQMDEIMI